MNILINVQKKHFIILLHVEKLPYPVSLHQVMEHRVASEVLYREIGTGIQQNFQLLDVAILRHNMENRLALKGEE